MLATRAALGSRSLDRLGRGRQLRHGLLLVQQSNEVHPVGSGGVTIAACPVAISACLTAAPTGCIEEVADLCAVLETRPVIDQAKGMLIAEHGCSPDEAFNMITAASQRNNHKVRDVARVDGAQTG